MLKLPKITFFISAVKRIHKKQCKNYGQVESQVTCIEDCLYEKMASENQTESDETSSEGKMRCRVPWIDRLKHRSSRTVELPLCHSKEGKACLKDMRLCGTFLKGIRHSNMGFLTRA